MVANGVSGAAEWAAIATVAALQTWHCTAIEGVALLACQAFWTPHRAAWVGRRMAYGTKKSVSAWSGLFSRSVV